ncbi:MAG: hypothetical protein JW829_19360 [Pirellulales bacterium]|nr:hypothetical protein [Pirellulales bacterium]
MNDLQTTVLKIAAKDCSGSCRSLPTNELTPFLPNWLDRSAHESAMLDQAMLQFASTVGTKYFEKIFMQTIVICEYVAGGYVLADRPNQPATQQIADAWFHKAELYLQVVTSRKGNILKRIDFLTAAEQCIHVALSNQEFVQSKYKSLHSKIKQLHRENPSTISAGKAR